MIRVLGIETSCDETAASVVALDESGSPQILSNIVLSQIEEHAAFGGVVPEIAARAHVEALDGIIEAALADAGVALADVDAIAATAGPGLVGGLIVGLMTAKALAAASGKPLQAINHLEGHALTARLTDGLAFPYLLLLVSGGHTQVVLVRGVGDYERWGTTIDDALGEAFDKTAKLIGLPYPGGPNVEIAARDGDRKRFDFPRPLKGEARLDFSFSGLKTAVRQAATAIAPLSAGVAISALFRRVGDTLDAASAQPRRSATTPACKPSLVAGGRRQCRDPPRWKIFAPGTPCGTAIGAVHDNAAVALADWSACAKDWPTGAMHFANRAGCSVRRPPLVGSGRRGPKHDLYVNNDRKIAAAAARPARRWPSPCGAPDMSQAFARDAATIEAIRNRGGTATSRRRSTRHPRASDAAEALQGRLQSSRVPAQRCGGSSVQIWFPPTRRSFSAPGHRAD